ncbi:hypothetical protein LQ50_11630 [Halalkalibacter okhensis]|uniref:Tail specific protease domain-containing protein n=1 Tax=Halalkalibacter okhensis TaxID=333138 RepID=A0A0B0IIS7_9BACI|nr:hypothetical protein LQ50_11630 [Halalkalibacter okhensis]
MKSLAVIAENNRFYTEHSFQEMPDHLYDYSKSKDDELSEEKLSSLTNSHMRTPYLTREKIIEDVEVLHVTLKHMYALYEYMGGDEAFEKAKEGVINSVYIRDEESELSSKQFIDLLKEHYGFVIDNHFHLDYTPINESEHILYFSERVQFHENAHGEYILAGNDRIQLFEINGDDDIKYYLKYSLDDDGNIVSIPAIFSNPLSIEEREWEITLKQEDSLHTEMITLEPMPKEIPRHQFGNAFAITEKDGVPWLQLRSMFVYEGADYDYYDMINTATLLKEEPYFVLDLRGNEGGSMILVDRWVDELFGQRVNWSSQSIHLFSNTSKAFIKDTIDFYQSRTGISTQTFEDDFTDLFRINSIENFEIPQWEIDSNSQKKIYDNQTHIFILVDNNTASAAEHLVAKLKLANNTTVLGVNTRGAIISGNSLMWRLPNTQVDMFTPTFFNYNPDLLHKELVGIQPDLWITATRVESRLLSFIKQNTESH